MAEDWAIYRICTHEATRGQQLADILERLTLDDVDALNTVLDAIDENHMKAEAAQRRRSKRRGRTG